MTRIARVNLKSLLPNSVSRLYPKPPDHRTTLESLSTLKPSGEKLNLWLKKLLTISSNSKPTGCVRTKILLEELNRKEKRICLQIAKPEHKDLFYSGLMQKSDSEKDQVLCVEELKL